MSILANYENKWLKQFARSVVTKKKRKKYYILCCVVLLALICTLSNVITGRKNNQDFCVIASVFNPASYKSRYESYRAFEQHIHSFGVQLITVELAFGNQTFQVTSSNNPKHIQLRTNDVLWYKENLLNIGIRHSPKDCEYIAWIDLEIEFLNKNWVENTKYALRKSNVVQLFETIHLLGPSNQLTRTDISYALCKEKKYDDEALLKFVKNKFSTCAPGFAWAAKKSSILNINGLFDKAIIGGADTIMLRGFDGAMYSQPESLEYGREFYEEILSWQKRAAHFINGSFGYVKGEANHFWHGSKKKRQYLRRKFIYSSYNVPFKPREYLYYDKNGLLHFHPEIRRHYKNILEAYFKSRQEDSELLIRGV